MIDIKTLLVVGAIVGLVVLSRREIIEMGLGMFIITVLVLAVFVAMLMRGGYDFGTAVG